MRVTNRTTAPDPGAVQPGARIQIKKSATADSMTCDWSAVTKEQLLQSSHDHISDVRKAIELFSCLLKSAAIEHDWDKITHISAFHKDFVTGFKEHEWWDTHKKISRHHIDQAEGVPQDINLIDIIEHIADGVMAGLARTGSVRPFVIDPQILQKAVENTANLLINEVEVKGGERG